MSKIYGAVTGHVESVEDPQGEGRIKVRFSQMGGESHWAAIATLMSGQDRGSWFMPEIGDEVLVVFNEGDVNHPYIIGFLWNGQQRPPATDPQLRLLRSVNGHEISIYDPDIAGGDTGYIRLQDAHGNIVELSNAMIKIQSVGMIQITAPNIVINGRPVSLAPKPI